MIKGNTTLIQKDPLKGTAPNNYRPITYLPIMWKISTVQIREEIYCSLTSCRLFPEEQKGFRKGYRGAEELLYIDKHIVNQSKTRRIHYKTVIWYRLANLDNKLLESVQNIRWSHKLYRENHENLENWNDSRREKFSWREAPKRYIRRICTITVTTFNCDDAT